MVWGKQNNRQITTYENKTIEQIIRGKQETKKQRLDVKPNNREK